ncbi:FkbM family methyltransferase [Paraburkholderia mimosarum]|uniref:FkbM family methyltransferase n=1 Tax=Paraburkholderia mimosarum TaxID=312026 RepID=UPI0009DDE0E1|nr:FkbM family methyltransferase [Paraburkholderia mimosarum]
MDRVSGHTFFGRFLRENSVVVDLGANMGAFSSQMARKFGCLCFAIEPNPECFAGLKNYEGVVPINLAIADREGEMRFYVANNSEASSFVRTSQSDREIVVRTMRLDALAQRHGIGHIDLLKIDIEGAEIALLDSLPDVFFRRVGQIAIEFHDFCGLISREDVARVERRFESLGFFSITFSKASHGHEDHLFVNRNRCSLGHVEYLTARYITRNLWGIARIARRWGGRWAAATAPSS